MITFEEARQIVVREVQRTAPVLAHETVSLSESLGRVLAQEVRADRPYPPFNRSIRDGYAVRAADVVAGAQLPCVGEIKAGDEPVAPLASGTCKQIMTGAAVPAGADAVVMIEQTRSDGTSIEFLRAAAPGQHFVPRGREAAEGEVLLGSGTRIGYAEIAVAAQAGAVRLQVFRKPRVAILSTGDEVVPAEAKPGEFQIRNSNAYSLAAQVSLAGGEPVLLGNAKDDEADLRAKIVEGLKHDLLILSGGVSAGKYDLVETVLNEMGTKFFFDAVAIRPGKPVVFGVCSGKPVFGLPGNPISTMVTFELFVVPAVHFLSGAAAKPVGFLQARLGEALHEKPGLAHFLPARIEWPENAPVVKPLRWQGSGDLATVSKCNCFLFVPMDRSEVAEGEYVSVLPRRDLL